MLVPDSIISDSVIPDSCFDIPDSVMPNSVIPDSCFACYNRFRYTRFPAPTVHLIAQFRHRNLDGKSLLHHLTIPLRFPHVVGGGRGGTLSSLRRHLFRLGNNIFLGRRRRRRRIRLSGRRAGRVFKSHTLDRLSSRRPRSVRRGLNGRIVKRSDVL